MNDKKIILPFDKYWIDCEFNAIFSVMTSIDESFYDFADINAYSYKLRNDKTPCGTDVEFIKLDNAKYIQSEYVTGCISKTPITLKDSEDMLVTIIKLLTDYTLLVGVDLYNWIPRSICWQKYHWGHFTLVQSYNKAEDTFSVLDESLTGYGEHRIPRERFIDAIQNSKQNEDGFILHYNTPSKYRLCFDDVLLNAQRLTTELTQILNSKTIWNLSSDDIEEGHMLDLFSMYAYQISNRHLANQTLVTNLFHLNCISSAEYAVLNEKFINLKRGWESIKNAFIWANELSPHKLDIDQLNEKKNQLLETELWLWDSMIK